MNTQITTLDTKLNTLSEKYKVVQTKLIADKFKSLGFTVDKYQETKVRKASKQGYQKHLVRLSNPELLTSKHSDVKLQLVITNSHDGLSAFTIKLGIYRFVCANGLMVGTTFESVSLRHTGNIIDEVDTAIEKMVAQLSKLDDAITLMKKTKLTKERQKQFLSEAIKIRYEDKSMMDVEIPILRTEDGEDNVFSLFNRVQETLERGGNRVRTNQNRLRNARSLTSISAITKLNESLFNLATEYTLAA